MNAPNQFVCSFPDVVYLISSLTLQEMKQSDMMDLEIADYERNSSNAKRTNN